MIPLPSAPRLVSTLLAAACLAGCQSTDVAEALDPTPAFAPVNHRGELRLPVDVHRVAILPVHGGGVAGPESAAVLDGVLVTALQKTRRFEVVVVSREECRRLFGATDFASVAALPHGFLDTISDRFGVDAVLFTDLTVYRPYGALALGFRSKLATTRDVRMVWAFDEVFSAEDPGMRQSVRLYQRRAAAAPLVDPAPAALQSPARFGAVAADLMFGTLPPR